MSRQFTIVSLLFVVLAVPMATQAATTGGHQLGISAGIISSEQEHINTLIKNANQREGGISTPSMNSAYEVTAHYGYRFSNSIIGVLLRPSFFYQKSSGTGTSGNFNYGLTGFTLFPMLRIYPLENNFMKFFMQFGVGYGRSSGTIEEGTAKVDFTGDGFGTTLGLGAEFCYVNRHCVALEGNWRYLTVQRNLADSATGTFSAGPPPSLSQAVAGREVEFDNQDLATRMGGLQALLGYVFRF